MCIHTYMYIEKECRLNYTQFYVSARYSISYEDTPFDILGFRFSFDKKLNDNVEELS